MGGCNIQGKKCNKPLDEKNYVFHISFHYSCYFEKQLALHLTREQ